MLPLEETIKIKDYITVFVPKHIQKTIKTISKDGSKKPLYRAINENFENLRTMLEYGVQVPLSKWPKYKNINNLWKVDLPLAHRLWYTQIQTLDGIERRILGLERHKDYGRKFGYGA